MKIQIIVDRLRNGGKGSVVEKPVYSAPPAAPQVDEAATLAGATTPEEEAQRVKKATTEGVKSLQIPVTNITSPSSTVGTGK